MNKIFFEILKVQVNGAFSKRGGRGEGGGAKRSTRRKALNNQPENRYHIIIRSENSPPNQE